MVFNTIQVALASSAVLIGFAQAQVQGFDISSYQGDVDFASAYNNGARFVIIKATEGTTYQSSTFSDQYDGATSAGFIRGGYHFANPTSTTGAGAEQAQYFLNHGGGWTPDGITLPGMLDLESSPESECWDMSPTAMVTFIQEFSDTYHTSTGRYPMLYTSPLWWQECTGDSTAFASTNPLVLAHWAAAVGPAPGGWTQQTIWQYANVYTYGGDADEFNGDLAALVRLATTG